MKIKKNSAGRSIEEKLSEVKKVVMKARNEMKGSRKVSGQAKQ